MKKEVLTGSPILLSWKRAAGRIPAASLLLFSSAVVIFSISGMAGILSYDRMAMMGGDFWRIFTCHWTHASFNHLVWDALTFLFLAVQCERFSRPRFLLSVLASAALIPVTLWYTMPEIELYQGLSGIDSALFALLAVLFLKEGWGSGKFRALLVAMFGLGFALKIGYELVEGSTVFVAGSGARILPVPLAHVVGAAIGLIAGVLPPSLKTIFSRKRILNGYARSPRGKLNGIARGDY